MYYLLYKIRNGAKTLSLTGLQKINVIQKMELYAKMTMNDNLLCIYSILSSIFVGYSLFTINNSISVITPLNQRNKFIP